MRYDNDLTKVSKYIAHQESLYQHRDTSTQPKSGGILGRETTSIDSVVNNWMEFQLLVVKNKDACKGVRFTQSTVHNLLTANSMGFFLYFFAQESSCTSTTY